MLAEVYYAVGERGTDAAQVITQLRKSAVLFPLDRRFRTASALLLINIAAQVDNDPFKTLAIAETRNALETDPTQADLLAMLITCELKLGQNAQAQAHYDQFKRVAKMSPMLALVNKRGQP